MAEYFLLQTFESPRRKAVTAGLRVEAGLEFALGAERVICVAAKVMLVVAATVLGVVGARMLALLLPCRSRKKCW